MPDTDPTMGEKILRQLKIQRYLTGVLAVILIVGFVDVAVRLSHVNNALCTFRGNLVTQVIQTQHYLVKHPEGFANVSKATILDSLNKQKKAIKSLDSLSCGGEKIDLSGTP